MRQWRLMIRPGVAARLVWSHADSVIAPFCSLCQAHIDDEALPPLMLWNEAGDCAQLCDPCGNDAFEVMR